MAKNKGVLFAGFITFMQAVFQFICAVLGIAQYLCLIDFMRDLPTLVFIRVLYFHNSDICGARINIGRWIEGMADQAFVLLVREPFTATRTFLINVVYFALGVLWMVSSVILMITGVNNYRPKILRLPWIFLTVSITVIDVATTVTYLNDTFHTRTLNELVYYINGMVSGAAGMDVNTSMASWTMVLLFSRFIVFFILNVICTVIVIISCNASREQEPENAVVMESLPMNVIERRISSRGGDDIQEISSSSSSETPPRIPRPSLSLTFRRMKTHLFKRPPLRGIRQSTTEGAPKRSPRIQHVDIDKKRTVNFPENLLSLPQRLENMIAEQQRRLDSALADTSGQEEQESPRVSQSMPQLNTSTEPEPTTSRGRRRTAAELQGQLPWAYIPASAHRMRDQLPPDEDLPPVPLPDYTAIRSSRKASVHRAASSLSSMTQKKDYTTSQSQRPDSPILTQMTQPKDARGEKNTGSAQSIF